MFIWLVYPNMVNLLRAKFYTNLLIGISKKWKCVWVDYRFLRVPICPGEKRRQFQSVGSSNVGDIHHIRTMPGRVFIEHSTYLTKRKRNPYCSLLDFYLIIIYRIWKLRILFIELVLFYLSSQLFQSERV